MSLSRSRFTALLTVCSLSALAACDDPAPSKQESTRDKKEDAASPVAGNTRSDASVDAGAPSSADARVTDKADASASDAKVSGNESPDSTNLKTDYQAWEARIAKLRSCDILDDGAFAFDPRLDQRCESLCMIQASCADLKTEACDQQAAEALESCFDACDEDVATCGDGKTVPAESVCDLTEDCSDGEDEKHCKTFTCKSGSRVAATSQCDGEPDCDDESDEQGCALVCGRPYAEVL